MAELAAAITAIKAIFKLYKGFKAIKDFFSGGTNGISLKEMQKLVAGESAKFFAVVTVAEVTFARDSFHSALTSITATEDVTADDLKTGGRLFREYDDLLKFRYLVGSNLKKLSAVLEQYANVLDVDVLVSGLVALFNGYGLLFHIHITYSELHRIQIGASSLDHPDLKYETQQGLQFIKDASKVLTFQIGEFNLLTELLKARMALVRNVRSVYVPFGTTRYYFKDKYDPPEKTPDYLLLSKPIRPEIAGGIYKEAVLRARTNYIAKVRPATEAFLGKFDLAPELTEHTNMLKARAAKQGLPSNFISTLQIYIIPAAQGFAMLANFVQLSTAYSLQIGSGNASEMKGASLEEVEPDEGEEIERDEEDKLEDEQFAKLTDEEFAKLEAATAELAAAKPELVVMDLTNPFAIGSTKS